MLVASDLDSRRIMISVQCFSIAVTPPPTTVDVRLFVRSMCAQLVRHFIRAHCIDRSYSALELYYIAPKFNDTYTSDTPIYTSNTLIQSEEWPVKRGDNLDDNDTLPSVLCCWLVAMPAVEWVEG
jgi:hypothetical protein